MSDLVLSRKTFNFMFNLIIYVFILKKRTLFSISPSLVRRLQEQQTQRWWEVLMREGSRAVEASCSLAATHPQCHREVLGALGGHC